MHVISLLLTACLASFGTLAAPTTGPNTSTSNLTKRDFKVHTPPRAGALRSPSDQIRRTFAKYGWEMTVGDADLNNAISGDMHKPTSFVVETVTMTVKATAIPTATSAASSFLINSSNSSIANPATSDSSPVVDAYVASTTSDGESDVTAVPQSNSAEFLVPITIGGQTLNLDFDTGSADLWTFSTLQPASELGTHSAFNPNQSSTWSIYDGAKWEIAYGDRSSASGIVGFDQVTVGDMTVTTQAVELANKVSSAFLVDPNSDGIIGLGFSNMNTIQPVSQKTWFDNILDQLDQPLFTADINFRDVSIFEFGVIDNTKFLGDLQFAAIDSSNGFWQFESNGYVFDDTFYACDVCSPAIADTGTTLILLDDDVVQTYYARANGTFSQAQSGYIYNCDTRLPDFSFAMGDNMVTLSGERLTYAHISEGSDQCFGAIQSNQGSGLQVYGDMFFEQYFAVFDAGNMTLGVAQKSAL